MEKTSNLYRQGDPPRAAAARRPVIHMSVVGTLVPGVSEELIFRCLESLFEFTAGASFEVRVTAIDNSPKPGLASRLRDRFPNIEVRENRERRGYAANHNAALAGSNADFFLICNDDLVFLPGCLERAVTYLMDPANARTGMIAFQFLNPDGSLQHSTYSFPTVPRMLLAFSGLRERVGFGRLTYRLASLFRKGHGRSRFWAHDRIVPVQTFMGAAMLVRALAARDVGPMDEVAMLGGEETEWHQRFWDKGWRIMFLPDARIVHHGGQTLRVLPSLEAEYLKGTLNFFFKHRPPRARLAFCTLAIPLIALRALLALAAGRREELDARRVCLSILLNGLRGVPPRVPATANEGDRSLVSRS